MAGRRPARSGRRLIVDDAGDRYDLLVVGGGINGAGIARDAAGRGLRVLLVERDDLAGHTSSASTKLIHGGLRYLEYGEVGLVRKALRERERLWGIAPHIIWPLRFVMPQHGAPRPGWMVRAGLFLYDHIGGRERLPATRTVRLDRSALGAGLSAPRGKAFVYSDCWVDDSRLVVLNALDAAERGATIRTRTTFVGAERGPDGWSAVIADASGEQRVMARAIVNATGPWAAEVVARIGDEPAPRPLRLVRGSHIVVPRLYDGTHAFTLQNIDRRVIFAIPYEQHHTLVGTTDQPCDTPTAAPAITREEVDYLLASINRIFARQVARDDIIWSYSGIRPLHDDHAGSASAVTRDYVFDVEIDRGGTLLSVIGGKITTYRQLAEDALHRLAGIFPELGAPWTATAPLPGGDMPIDGFETFAAASIARHPGLPASLVRRLARAYGTRLDRIVGTARTLDDLGPVFGADLTRVEVDYLVNHEWAQTGDDILFRRSKLGLRLTKEEAGLLDVHITAKATQATFGRS